MKKWFVLMAVLVVIAAGAAFGWQVWKSAPATLEIAGIHLSQPKAVADFKLTDGSGESFTPAQLRGKWSFLYFGYTYCPDACPLAMGVMQQLTQRLAEQNLNDPNQYILVSVDPRRDTPQRLAEYVDYFNPEFHGVTGDPIELNKFAKPMGVYYSVPEDPEDPENYLVEHSSAIVLINPDAELQALFTPPLDSIRIAEDFAAVRERYLENH